MCAYPIDPVLKTKLCLDLERSSGGSCFVRCTFQSVSKTTLSCLLTFPLGRVRISVQHDKLRDDQGDKIPAGEPAYFGTKGWVLAEVASRSNASVFARIYQTGDLPIEVDVSTTDVIENQNRHVMSG